MNIPIKQIQSKFDNVKVHQGINHIKDRLYIHLDVTTICNYKCTYCCNRAEFKDWQKPAQFSTLMRFLDELEIVKSKYDTPIFLMFTGGEPTFAIKYFALIDRARTLLSHANDRLVLESNGSRDIEFYRRYPTISQLYRNVYHMFSIHPEHTKLEDLPDYIEKLQLICSYGYKVKVNLMMNHSESHYKFMLYAYNLLIIKGIDVHPHFIYHKSETNQIKYPKKFWDKFGGLMSECRKDYDQDGEHLTDYELFKEQRNQFKGWMCYHNNITVSIDGSISNQCFNIDSIEDVFELMNGKLCPYDSCNCDGLLKIRKCKIN